MSPQQREEIIRTIRNGGPVQVGPQGIQTAEQSQSNSADSIPIKSHRWGMELAQER